MRALWLRLSAVFTLIFALALAGVHALPYDNASLIAFFAPPGCAAPCFMGIRPGVTTHDQALALLKSQAWVGSVSDSPVSLRWNWNGQQPAFVSDPPNDVQGGQINFVSGQVYSITLSTATRWAEFFGAFGVPDQEFMRAGENPNGFYPYVIHTATYTAYDFEVDTNTLCPFKSRADLWYSPVSIVVPSQPLNGLIPVSRGC
ncbi:MAG TPA: hypothetical protein VHD90_13270 [Phototrophicaceae bacterium]|nr:hypothetical protein [Phototrophicaceae bacterium]